MLRTLQSIFQPFTQPRYAIGLEITDSKIKIVQLVFHSEHAVIDQYVSYELAKNVVEDGRIKDPIRLQQSLQSAVAQLRLKTGKVHFVMPSQTVMVRFIKVPDLPMKDMKKLVDFELKHQIHLPFEQPVYDFIKLTGLSEGKQIRNMKKEEIHSEAISGQKEAAASHESSVNLEALLSGKVQSFNPEVSDRADTSLPCDVMLAAAPQELINQYLNVMRSARLKPKSVEIKALSLFRMLRYGKIADSAKTILVLEINEKETDVSIFHGGVLKITRSFPLELAGGQAEKSPSSDPVEALLLGTPVADDPLTQFATELAHELERLMNFYRYTLNNRDQEFSQILLAGNVRNMNQVQDVLLSRLRVHCAVIRADNIQWGLKTERAELYEWAVPIGLALRGRDR